MKWFIRKLLLESLTPLKFHKIEVELFSDSSSTSIDYELGSRSHSQNSTPRKKIRITPIIDLKDKRFEKFFDYDEGVNLSYVEGFYGGEYGYNTIILCQEGILSYVEDSDSDCDGSWYSFTGNFTPHSKIKDWEQIKNHIKPILRQTDIDNAIRMIGKTKEFCKNPNLSGRHGGHYLLKTLKDKGSLENSYLLYDEKYVLKINGKYGLFDVRGGKLKTILPLVFDKFDKKGDIKKGGVLLLRKGDLVYNYELFNYKFKLIKKEQVNDIIAKLKDTWQEVEPEISFDKFIKYNMFDKTLSIYF